MICCCPGLFPNLCKAKATKISKNQIGELKKLKELADSGLDIGQATGSKSCKFIGKALIIFETQLMVAEFLDEFGLEDKAHRLFVKNNLDCGKYDANIFDINPNECPPDSESYVKPQKVWPINIDEPDDIIWENLDVEDMEFFKKQVLITIMNLLSFSIVFGLLYRVNGINQALMQSGEPGATTLTESLYLEAIALTVSYGVVLISMIQQAIMQWASQFSGYHTNTEMAASEEMPGSLSSTRPLLL
jgi:hypothetical protein